MNFYGMHLPRRAPGLFTKNTDDLHWAEENFFVSTVQYLRDLRGKKLKIDLRKTNIGTV